MNLDRVTVTRKSGRERFHDGTADLGYDLLTFWQWSSSDLLSNSMRGVLAEYLVARALRPDAPGVREEWASYDLTTDIGIKVEVKSAGYLQSWHQDRVPHDPETRRNFSVLIALGRQQHDLGAQH